MKTYLNVIKKANLFRGIDENEIEAMLGCLCAVTKEYEKNQFVLRFGDTTNTMGLVLCGNVHIIKDDFWGNRNIVSTALPGHLFGETYACTPGTALCVSVIAAEPTTVMFLDVRRILTTCSSACEFHSRLMHNLLSVLAQKNLMMNEKLTHMSRRNTREKLLSYLSSVAVNECCSSFEIPFNRQQLADYLSVDRSAMSNELCKMRDEGFIQFNRNHFELTGQEDN